MISFTYDRTNNTTKIDFSDMEIISNHFPLKVIFEDIITGEVHYQSNVRSNMWVSWQGGEFITNIKIYSANGKLIFQNKWDVTVYGDEIEKLLWYYLQGRKLEGKFSKGLVIGSHDGRNGHWVYPVKDQLTDVVLIDGSEKQFSKLKWNYKNYPNVTMINQIVTTDGHDVIWHQGGHGYTDTIVENFINNWIDETEIVTSNRQSISIVELMDQTNFDWLHLDVEGYDADLIMGLKKFPNIIIFESMNLSKEKLSQLNNWFIERKYSIIESMGNQIAISKNITR